MHEFNLNRSQFSNAFTVIHQELHKGSCHCANKDKV